MPLDSLAKCMNDVKLRSLSSGLFYSSTHVIGIGIRGEQPEGIGATHWVCHTPLNFSRNQTNVALQLTFLRVIVPFIVPPYFQTIPRTINLQLRSDFRPCKLQAAQTGRHMALKKVLIGQLYWRWPNLH